MTLTEAQMPAHTHTLRAGERRARNEFPSNQTAFGEAAETTYGTGTVVDMSPQAITNAGGSQAHNNLQPYLAINFIIALVGLYPSRS